MSRDPEVMAAFPKLLSPDEAAATAQAQREYIAEHGHGLWAVELKAGPFIGFCGIREVRFAAPFVPAFEIGWRFARAHWGHGYATEAAREAMRFGFEELQLRELVAFLLPANVRSARVCERLGMIRDPSGDFDHPDFTPDMRSVGGFPQQRHILYRT